MSVPEEKVPESVPTVHAVEAETMVLPAFLTGRKTPEPKPAEPARHQAEGALPRNERGMLLFVAALLGVGTIAVVVMLGVGSLSNNSPGSQPHPPIVDSATATASVTPSSTPSASPSPSPSPPRSSPPSPSPSRVAPSTHKAPALLGQADLDGYCDEHGGGRPVPRRGGWFCFGDDSGQPVTADRVCDWQFGRSSHAVVGNPYDPRTWRCYR